LILVMSQPLCVSKGMLTVTGSPNTSDCSPPGVGGLANQPAFNLTWNPILPYPLRGLKNPANVYIGQHKAGTARTYMSKLNTLAHRLSAPHGDYEYLNWSAFDLPQTKALINTFLEPDNTQSRLSNSSINGYLSLIKNIVHHAALMGLVGQDQTQRVLSIKALKISSGLSGRMATPEEKNSLFEYCLNNSNRTKGSRDCAVLAFLFFAGLRRHEIGLIDISDINMDQQKVTIRGKGNTEETIEMAPLLLIHLKEWIQEYRGDYHGALFPRITKEGVILYDTRLTGSGVRDIVKNISIGSGLVGDLRLRPHDARRTFGSELLDITDIKTAADLMRHSNINQTAKYDRRKGERRKAALDLLCQ